MENKNYISKSSETIENEKTIFDLLLIPVRERKLIIKIITIIGIIGLLIAFLSPRTYKVTTRMIPEISGNDKGGLSLGVSALRNFGVDISGLGTVGITQDTYPDIIKSRDVLMKVLKDTIFLNEEKTKIPLIDIMTNKKSILGLIIKYTIGLPRQIINIFKEDKKFSSLSNSSYYFMTQDEEYALNNLNSMIIARIDDDTGVLSLSVEAENSYLAIQIVTNLINHFSDLIKDLYSEKKQQNVDFLKQELEEIKIGLEKSENELALFVDQNVNLQSAVARVELEQLQRKVSFKADVFTEIQRQLTSAEIELQRSLPVISIIEKPRVPEIPSGPKRSLILIFSLFFGFLAGIFITFIKYSINQRIINPVEKNKFQEIKDIFHIKKIKFKK